MIETHQESIEIKYFWGETFNYLQKRNLLNKHHLLLPTLGGSPGEFVIVWSII